MGKRNMIAKNVREMEYVFMEDINIDVKIAEVKVCVPMEEINIAKVKVYVLMGEGNIVVKTVKMQ